MTKVKDFFKQFGFSDEAVSGADFDPTSPENTGAIINFYAKNPQISALHATNAGAAHFNKLKAKITELASALPDDYEDKKAALSATNFDDALSAINKIVSYKPKAAGGEFDLDKIRKEAATLATAEMQKQIKAFERDNKELSGKYEALLVSSKISPIASSFVNYALDADVNKAATQKTQRANLLVDALKKRVDIVFDKDGEPTYIDKSTKLPAMEGTSMFSAEDFMRNEAANYGWYTQLPNVRAMPGGAPMQSEKLSDDVFKPKFF